MAAKKFPDFLVSLLMPMLKAAAKFYLKDTLQKIQDHNSTAVYTNTLKSINSSFLLLDEVAKKSNTKIDDDVIEAVLESVQESAAEDGITL